MTTLLLATLGVLAQPLAWHFESDTCGWQPRLQTIAVTRVASERESSRGSLHLQGRINEGFEKYRLESLSASLWEVRGIHPRLYLDTARIAELRQTIQTTHAPMGKKLRKVADARRPNRNAAVNTLSNNCTL